MRSFITRTAAVAAVLLVAMPATAGAAVDEYAAEASTSAVRIAAFEEAVGSPLLDLLTTDAFASSDPTASAAIDPVQILGEKVGTVRMADSDGAPDRDPEEGEGCVLPEVSATGLTLDAICATAAADAGPSDDASANSTAELLAVGLSGSFVSAVLTEPLDVLLNDLTDGIADGATADAIAMFTAECDAFLDTAVPNEADELPGTVADLIGMLPEGTDAITDPVQGVINDVSGEDACSAIIDLTLNEVVAPIIDVQPLADALAGQNLIQLSVDGARSDVLGEDAALTSTGEQALVTLTGPSLDFLDDVIVALLEGIEGGLVTTIEGIVGQELPGELDITDDVQGVLDMIPLFGITDPFLTATVSGGTASATLDNDSATTSSGGERPYVELTIAPGVFALLGQGDPGPQRFEAGETQTIGEAPLVATVSVGDLITDDEAEFEGLSGSSATASVTTVSLLDVEGAGSIEIALAESNAAVYAASLTTAGAPDPDPLPNTGGGAAVAAAMALGAALLLRRRRD